MNKCDFCPYSKNVNGKLTCPYVGCILTRNRIEEILDKLGKVKRW